MQAALGRQRPAVDNSARIAQADAALAAAVAEAGRLAAEAAAAHAQASEWARQSQTHTERIAALESEVADARAREQVALTREAELAAVVAVRERELAAVTEVGPHPPAHLATHAACPAI